MRQTVDLPTAVECAMRAPSVHNTQPWRWRFRGGAVELHADWKRQLVATDPDRRDLVLSCGAALHHLLVALAAAGHAADVNRLPDPEDPAHVATVTVRPGPADPADAALFPAIARRRTDRRRMGDRQVPDGHLMQLSDHARRNGAALLPLTDEAMQRRLRTALADAALRQHFAPGYVAELEVWTRRYEAARDGVSGASVPEAAAEDSPLRRFPHGHLAQPPGPESTGDAAELLVLATTQDGPLDRLRAGEATSAVLLAATLLGLATTPLSQAVEVDQTRRAIQRDVLHVPEHPQLILRVGWPAEGAGELPVTPRRDLWEVQLST